MYTRIAACFAVCVMMACVLIGAAPAGRPSQLWGTSGERWNPTSRLPDFSFAGYRCGEKPIPLVPVVADVKKFGARGDGSTDDTAAFLAAINATEKGAIFIPAGRYVIKDVLTLNKTGLVLRGAGPDKTVLVAPTPLSLIHPKDNVDEKKAAYSFTGGFIVMKGNSTYVTLSEIAQPAKRGDRRLVLKKAVKVQPGDFVRISMNNDPALGRLIHADQMDAGEATFKERKQFVDWVARVESVAGTAVTLDRPLRIDVRPEFDARFHSWTPRVEDMGVEDLSFEFPGTPKKAHLQEEGFNAIHMTGAINSWVRNVTFTDADNGIIVNTSRFCRIENTRFCTKLRKNPSGHHALWASGSTQDCLFVNFALETRYVHDLTVEGLANGNVFMRGTADSMNFDHHRNAPYENLFTELNAGDVSRLWASSGRQDRGPHSGARSTFWNIRYASGRLPKLPDFPQANIVGVDGYPASLSPDQQWIEPIMPTPVNLYEAQLKRRLKR